MNIEIQEITVKKKVIDAGAAVHLSLNGDPINPYSPLWQKVQPENTDAPVTIATNPAAFTVTGLKDLVLEMKLYITGAEPGIYQLMGYDAQCYPHTLPTFTSGLFKIKEKGDILYTIKDIHLGKLTEIFFGISANIPSDTTWVICSPPIPPDKGQIIGQTDLEIYNLYNQVDFNFFRRGVPVEILRYLDIVYINSFCRDMKPDCPFAAEDEIKLEAFVEYIVKTCFFRNPPRYDIYMGTAHFSDLHPKKGHITGGIFLDMYLNALDDSDALCNCKDQAAALFSFLSAVGIGDVDICYMNPFGFLKLSLLVGREFVNNPIYEGKRENKIVPPRKADRSSFGLHSFCAWKNNSSKDNLLETKILDACVGPHTGNENKEQYVSETVDTVYPGNSKPGTAGDISQYKVKAVVDYISGPNMSRNPLKNNRYFTVCEWADPRACPVLGYDWNIVYEKTFAGDVEVLKVWKLRKKGESIHIKLFVNSSADTQITKNRFFTIYTSTTHPENKCPYEKGNTFLGKLAAQSRVQHTRRVFWVPHFESFGLSNVTFDVMCTNATFNVDALLVWLNQMALTRRAFSLAPFRPSMEDIKITPDRPKVGDKVMVSLVSDMNLMLDFLLLRGSGLRLIDQGILPTNDATSPLDIHPKMEFFLQFVALKKSQNKLRIVAVDKNTLLCNSVEKNVHINPK